MMKWMKKVKYMKQFQMDEINGNEQKFRSIYYSNDFG